MLRRSARDVRGTAPAALEHTPPFPSPAALVRGATRHGALVIADRFGAQPSVQRRYVTRSVTELLRRLPLAHDAQTAALHAAQASYWSQHGEDGILAELVARVGAPSRHFVEIGASDGEENCTRALAEDGWSGTWFEADRDRAARAAAVAARLRVTVRCELVTARTVAPELRSATSADTDVLVVDIDSSDFWVVRAALRAITPRIVVTEYNSSFPPGAFWTRRRRAPTWDDTFRHGASLDALTWACGRAGYALVGCESSGANAFFVRRDLLDGAQLLATPVASAFRPLVVAPPAIGHPSRVQPDCPRLSAADFASTHLVAPEVLGTGDRGRLVGVRARVVNSTPHRLTSTGPHPLRLSAHLLGRDGSIRRFDGDRNWLHGSAPPYATAWVGGVFRVDDPSVTTLRLCLVQEGVGWLEAGACDLDLPSSPSTG